MIGQHVEENKRMCLSLFLCSCHPLFNEKLIFQLFQFNNQIPYTHSSTFLNMALRLFPVQQDQKHLFRRNDKHLIIRGIRKKTVTNWITTFSNLRFLRFLTTVTLRLPFLSYSNFPDFQYFVQNFPPSKSPPEGSRFSRCSLLLKMLTD